MITILIAKNTDAPAGGKSGGALPEETKARTRLLREGLRVMGQQALAERFTPDMPACTEDGKPYLPGYSDLYFNLSHSGDYIACAFSDREVGMDLQQHGPTHTSILRISKRFFTAAEYEALLALPEDEAAESPVDPDISSCREQLFYRFWSIKEAYLKYLGCGLRGKMNGYLPDPFPDSGLVNDTVSSPHKDSVSENREAEEKTLRGQGSPDHKPLRGRIRILNDDPLLTPAEYALVEAPDNYTIAVCAELLPEEITVRMI